MLFQKITNDGSLSLHSDHFNEMFHSKTGAFKEAQEKFFYPAEIDRLQYQSSVNILDICLGLGYNTASLLEGLRGSPLFINWWGLEIDKKPLQIALGNKNFRKTWSPSVINSLELIHQSNGWEEIKSKGRVIWGDARETIKTVPSSIKFDLILHDGFSPQKCPELWSEEFLNELIPRLKSNGRFITYSCAAAIRASLKRSGLKLHSLIPLNSGGREWSSGTMAAHQIEKESINKKDPKWQLLSEMEEEHLRTKAAIPYRDPTNNSTSFEILQRREVEQSISNLKSTTKWKKKWEEQKGTKTL